MRTTINYRKIYTDHYGPIPKDSKGRRFEIHHIDGDSNNNDSSNLVALSLEDHYNVHYEQNDWIACVRIAAKLNKTGEEIRELALKAHAKRIKENKHPWQKKPDGSSHTRNRISDPNYVNPFTGRNKGTSNSRYRDDKYDFYNTKTNEQLIGMTQYEFTNLPGMDQPGVSRLINGKAKHHRNWIITKRYNSN